MFLLLKIKLHFSKSVKTFTQKILNQVKYTKKKISSLYVLEIVSVSYQGCLTYYKEKIKKILIK